MYKLKCKIGALAAEARFTRKQERREMKNARRVDAKFPDTAPNNPGRRIRALDMRLHRVGTIRITARTALLAYAFLRGKPYLLVERKCYRKPRWAEVEKEILRQDIETFPRRNRGSLMTNVEDVEWVKDVFREWKDAKATKAMKAKWRKQDAANARTQERQREMRKKRGWAARQSALADREAVEGR